MPELDQMAVKSVLDEVKELIDLGVSPDEASETVREDKARRAQGKPPHSSPSMLLLTYRYCFACMSTSRSISRDVLHLAIICSRVPLFLSPSISPSLSRRCMVFSFILCDRFNSYLLFVLALFTGGEVALEQLRYELAQKYIVMQKQIDEISSDFNTSEYDIWTEGGRSNKESKEFKNSRGADGSAVARLNAW
jgi:hypothetical protein